MFEPEIEEGFEEMFAEVRRDDLGCFFDDDEPDLVDVVREVNGAATTFTKSRADASKLSSLKGKSGALLRPT